MTDSSALIEVCRLWTKRSSRGRTYLMGRMAGVRGLIFENSRGEGDHSHVLMFGEAPAKDQPRQQATGAERGRNTRRPSEPPQATLRVQEPAETGLWDDSAAAVRDLEEMAQR
jgi:hypothetical protein